MTESESLFSPLPKVVKKEFTLKQYFSSSNLSSVKLHETEECSSFTFLAVSLFCVCANSKAENCFLLIPQYSCNTFPPLRSLLVFPGPCLCHLPKTCKEQQRFLAGSYSETTCFCRRPQNRGLNGPTNKQIYSCQYAPLLFELQNHGKLLHDCRRE